MSTHADIEYVIFDMDGLLIDTERVYTEVTNEILAPYGKKMTWDIKAGLMGKPEKEATDHLFSFFPDVPLTREEYLARRNALQNARWSTVQPLPGAVALVKHLHAAGIPLAVATGSRRSAFVHKSTHLPELFTCFKAVVCADDIPAGRGKPAPDVFLAAARALGRGADATDCARGLVFEDAIPGVQAGKCAGMSVVWVPDANLLGVAYDGAEKPDQTIRSLEEFVPEQWGLPSYKV